MSSEWEIVEIGDVCSVGDGAHSKVNRQADGVLYLTSKNIGRGTLKLDKVDYISQDDFERLFPVNSKATRRPQTGDILIGIIGTFGNAYVYKSSDNFGFASSIGILRPNPSILNSDFFYYVITSRTFQVTHANYNAGSVQGYTNIPTIKKLSLPLPPLMEQIRIAELLKSLDDRIALLRETNATLEAIAQALFKSWFVDFDPVHAKARGEPPQGMDDATAALFPDSFEESELGMIPKGWWVNTINDVVEGTYDGPHATPPESSDGPIFLGIKNLTGTSLVLNDIRHIAEQDFSKWTKRVTPKGGDIVFSYEATLGFFALVPDGMRCCLGRRLALVRPHDKDGFGCFWFHQFISEPFQRHLTKHTIQGATVNRIALKEFPKYPMLNPPHEIKKSFDDVASGIWEKIHINQRQAQTLAQLRDTLLPKLISGQLRLPEAEALLAEELP